MVAIVKRFTTFVLFIILFFPGRLTAQISEPVNSNYLIENGISPRMLDAAASSFMQDGIFTNSVYITISDSGGIEKKYEIDIIYDPKYMDGMDIRVVDKNGNIHKKEKKILRKHIERGHYFSRMTKDYIYDESSLKLIRNDKDTVVLEFYYSKKDLDPYLRDIKRVRGEVFIVDGILKRVILKNVKPLKKHIIEYKKTVDFAKVKSGGYIVDQVVKESTVKKKNNLISYNLHSRVIDYKTLDGKELTWDNKINEPIPSGVKYDTINVKLGGPLPLWGKSATKTGYQLPRPIGVAAFTHFQSQFMQITSLQVGLDDGDMVNLNNVISFDESDVTLNSSIYLAKADVWLFPFLNIMAIFGSGRNELNAELYVNEDLRDFLEGLPEWIDVPYLPESIPINSILTSEIYGGGATLAGGISDFNFSISYQLMFTNIVEANTTNMVNIITPMIGYMAPFGVNFMAGTQGQFYETLVKGFFEFKDVNDNPHKLNYNIDFEPIRWNGMIGFYKGFNKHWEMSIQVGFGQRTSVTAIFGYRL